MRVGAELIARAAEAGQPDAQAEVGFRAALGLHPVSQTSFAFGEPDVPKCGPRLLPTCVSLSACR